MQVIVRDRRQGKTTELIKWLLEGYEQNKYPYWSRVLVCHTTNATVNTTRMLLNFIKQEEWDPCGRMIPHHDHSEEGHFQIVTDVRKAVWSLSDLEHNARAGRDFEYALDDADMAMFMGVRLDKRPAIISVTGELHGGLRD